MESSRRVEMESKISTQVENPVTVSEFSLKSANGDTYYLEETELLSLSKDRFVNSYNYSREAEIKGVTQLWNTSTSTPTLVTTLSETSPIKSLAALPNGRFVTSHKNGNNCIWDNETGHIKGFFSAGHDSFLTVLSCGWIVSWNFWNDIKVWNIDVSLTKPVAILHSLIQKIDMPLASIKTVLELPNGTIAAIFSTSEVKIWDLNFLGQEPIRWPLSNLNSYDKFAVLLSGHIVRSYENEAKIDILDPSDGHCVSSFPTAFLIKQSKKHDYSDVRVLPNGNIFSIFQSPGYQCIGVIDTSDLIQCKWVWHRESKEEKHKNNFKNTKILEHEVLASGHVVLAHAWGKVSVVDTNTGTNREVVNSMKGKLYSPVMGFSALSDGRVVFSEDNLLHFYDVSCVQNYYKEFKEVLYTITPLPFELLNVVGCYNKYPDRLFVSPMWKKEKAITGPQVEAKQVDSKTITLKA